MYPENDIYLFVVFFCFFVVLDKECKDSFRIHCFNSSMISFPHLENQHQCLKISTWPLVIFSPCHCMCPQVV